MPPSLRGTKQSEFQEIAASEIPPRNDGGAEIRLLRTSQQASGIPPRNDGLSLPSVRYLDVVKKNEKNGAFKTNFVYLQFANCELQIIN